MPCASALAWAATTRLDHANSSGLGAKAALAGLDLLGVDQGFAVKAECAALTARKGKPFVIGEIEVDPVECRQPMSPGGEQQ